MNLTLWSHFKNIESWLNNISIYITLLSILWQQFKRDTYYATKWLNIWLILTGVGIWADGAYKEYNSWTYIRKTIKSSHHRLLNYTNDNLSLGANIEKEIDNQFFSSFDETYFCTEYFTTIPDSKKWKTMYVMWSSTSVPNK